MTILEEICKDFASNFGKFSSLIKISKRGILFKYREKTYLIDNILADENLIDESDENFSRIVTWSSNVLYELLFGKYKGAKTRIIKKRKVSKSKLEKPTIIEIPEDEKPTVEIPGDVAEKPTIIEIPEYEAKAEKKTLWKLAIQISIPFIMGGFVSFFALQK